MPSQARHSRRRGAQRSAHAVSTKLLDETVIAPSEENGFGLASPDMLQAAKTTVLRSAGVLSTSGHETAMLGGSFGSGASVFDASRALAVLHSLAETSEAEVHAGAMMDKLSAKISELRALRTTSAEAALKEHEAAVAARAEVVDEGVAALREELEATRARLAKTEAELHGLRTEPPAPSEAVVMAHPAYVEVAEARAVAEARLERATRQLGKMRQDRSTLLKAAAKGAGAAEGKAARAAMARELQESQEQLGDLQTVMEALTGMRLEPDSDDGTVWKVTVKVDDEEAEMALELVDSLEKEDEDQDEGDDEGGMTLRPLRGESLLPEYLHEAISFPASEATSFMRQFLASMMGDDEDEEEQSKPASSSSSAVH